MNPKPITKAVIACAGWSTRFLPAVKTYAKHLIPLVDQPHLQYIVQSLYNVGITDICIIHRQGEDTIKAHFTHDPVLEDFLKATGKTERLESLNILIDNVKFTYFAQTPEHPYGNATPALIAKDWIGQDDFIYLFGDDIIIEPNSGQFIKEMLSVFYDKNPDCVMAIQQVPWEEIHRYGAVKFDQNDPTKIVGVFEKVPKEVAPSNFSQVSPYIYKNSALETITNLKAGKDNELWLADANNILGSTGTVLSAQVKDGLWITTGDPLNWLKANLLMAHNRPDLWPEIQKLLATLK